MTSDSVTGGHMGVVKLDTVEMKAKTRTPKKIHELIFILVTSSSRKLHNDGSGGALVADRGRKGTVAGRPVLDCQNCPESKEPK